MGTNMTSNDSAVLNRMRQAWEVRASANPLFYIDPVSVGQTLADVFADGEQLVAQIVDPVLEKYGVDPTGRRVLEIGCGIGRLFPGLATRFAEVWGVDISQTMIARGRKHCPVAATWILGDGGSLTGVQDHAVGHVVSYEVFQHIPDPDPIWAYLREIHRVLKPGGTFQVQLRRGSDSKQQALFRALSPGTRSIAVLLLRGVGYLRVIADVDTWIGCIIDPIEATSRAVALGFTDVSVLPDTLHANGIGFWLIGKTAA